jgi:hypothetical protein
MIVLATEPKNERQVTRTLPPDYLLRLRIGSGRGAEHWLGSITIILRSAIFPKSSGLNFKGIKPKKPENH